jgi:hypothetical protein
MLVAAVATLYGARPESEFTAEQLRRERTVVQFLLGERDPFGGLDVARRAVELMPNARLHEMNAATCLFSMTQPNAAGSSKNSSPINFELRRRARNRRKFVHSGNLSGQVLISPLLGKWLSVPG